MLLMFIWGGSQKGKAIKRYIDTYIPLQYEDNCIKCGRKIPAGEYARYILYIFEDNSKKYMFICEDCDVESNRKLWKLIRKKKELEVAIKQLNKELEKKIELLNNVEYQIKVAELKREILQLVRDIRQYITNDQKIIELAKKT
jgi:hypothetical protein